MGVTIYRHQPVFTIARAPFVCYSALSCDVCRSGPAERLARRTHQRAPMLEQSGTAGRSFACHGNSLESWTDLKPTGSGGGGCRAHTSTFGWSG